MSGRSTEYIKDIDVMENTERLNLSANIELLGDGFIRKYYFHTRSSELYCFDRNFLSHHDTKLFLNNSGVYVLLGELIKKEIMGAYTGHSLNGKTRSYSHENDFSKEFFTEVIFWTSKYNDMDLNFLKAYEYLTNKAIQQAGTCGSMNNNKISLNPIEKRDKKSIIDQMSEFRSLLHIAQKDILGKEEFDMIYDFTHRNFEAKARYSNGCKNFMVLAGSQAQIVSSEPEMQELKEKLLKEKVLKQNGDVYIFNEDTEFNNISQANRFICGHQNGGASSWVDYRGESPQAKRNKE
jgi:hypothetical protein